MQQGLHAYFKLSASGEEVVLSDADEVLVDYVSYDDQDTDVSYGRFPNGTGDFGKMNATPDAENDELSSIEGGLEEVSTFNIFPNPARDNITISAEKTNAQVKIYVTDGSMIYNGLFSKVLTIDVSDFTPGIYIVIIDNEAKKIIIQ